MTTYTPREPYVGAYTSATGRVEIDSDPRSLGDLFSDLAENASLLARQEVQLAKVEMQEKVTKASREVATIGVGAALANAALLALTAAAILGLSLYMSPWVAALVVALVLGVIAGLLVWRGVSALKEMSVVPEQTVATLKEDQEWLSRQMN